MDKETNQHEVVEVVQQKTTASNLVFQKFRRFLYFLSSGIEFLLGLRLLLKLFAADPNNLLAIWIYRITDILLIPFEGLTPTYEIGNGVIESYVLIAMILYAVLIWAVVEVLAIIFYQKTGKTIKTYKREEDISQ